jgi:hypothetical protein
LYSDELCSVSVCAVTLVQVAAMSIVINMWMCVFIVVVVLMV